MTNFTLNENFVYFGAGYNLYRLDLANRELQKIYTTDRILVEQPLVADNIAYFGGSTFLNQYGSRGEKQGFFAVDLTNSQKLWKFPLGVGGYGTYGTYPVIAGDKIIICAREYLHALDRKEGEELWRIENWMGGTGTTITKPYIHNEHVYYPIAEEHVARSQKTDENDGHWAEVSLQTGERTSILKIAEKPGTYQDSDGMGYGNLVDGIIYGKMRIDRFGALDLDNKKMLWEIKGVNYPRPAVSDKYVFTVVDKNLQALDRNTGNIAWSFSLEGLTGDITDQRDRNNYEYENYFSKRFALAGDTLFVQTSQVLAAFNAANGEKIWITKIDADSSTIEPVIWQNQIITGINYSAIASFDSKSGKMLWKVDVPDAEYYFAHDD